MDPNTGALTIAQKGTATITITAAETEQYQKAEKDITVTVVAADRPVPDKPELDSVTPVTITIKAKTGEEYSIDDGNTWNKPQSDENNLTFDNLEPGKDYAIIAKAETDTGNPPATSEPLIVTTPKGHVQSEIILDDTIAGLTVSGFDDALAAKLSTSEEITAAEAGEDVVFTLKITKLDNPPAADKSLCDEAIAAIGDNAQAATYLDVSIEKIVGDAEPVKVTDTKGNMITVTFDIPAELTQVSANTQRDFYIIRVHDGKAEQLPATVENGKISFQSDKFSTYTMAYQDTASQSGSDAGQNATNTTNTTNGNNGSTTSAKTGVQGNDNLDIALDIAGMALVIGVTAYLFRRKKGNQ